MFYGGKQKEKGKIKKEKAHESRDVVLAIKPNPLFKNQTEHKKKKQQPRVPAKPKEMPCPDMFV